MLLALGLNVVVGWAGCSTSASSRSAESVRTCTLRLRQVRHHLPTVVAVPLVIVVGSSRRPAARLTVPTTDG
jgi:hypothetical protein